MKTTLSPKRARTFQQICRLNSDGHSTKKYWISIDIGVVHIYQQESGKQPEAKIEIPRRDFEALAGWYYREQKLRRKS